MKIKTDHRQKRGTDHLLLPIVVNAGTSYRTVIITLASCEIARMLLSAAEHEV